jgi:hypothetical protein
VKATHKTLLSPGVAMMAGSARAAACVCTQTASAESADFAFVAKTS